MDDLGQVIGVDRMPDVTLWLTGNTCPHCNTPISTDGRRVWCSPDCKDDDRRKERTKNDGRC